MQTYFINSHEHSLIDSLVLLTSYRAQNNGRSPDNVRPRWLFVRTKSGFGGHFDRSRTRFPNKIICFISGKHKQLNHKISRQLVVTKMGRGFFKFFQIRRKKISVFENIRIRVDRALVFFLETESVYSQNRIQRKSKNYRFVHMRRYFWFNGEIIPNKYFQHFDRSKTRHDRAKIGLASQHDRSPFKNYFEPCPSSTVSLQVTVTASIMTMIAE